MKKIFIPIFILLVFSACDFLERESAQIEEKEVTDSTKESAEGANLVEVSDSEIEVPAEWGDLVWSEVYETPSINESGRSFQDVYRLIFENDIEAVYQKDVDAIYWVQSLDSGECDEMFEKYTERPGFSGSCLDYTSGTMRLVKDGFLDLSTQEVVETGDQVMSVQGTASNYFNPYFLGFESMSDNQYRVFTPDSKYFVRNGSGYESCYADVIYVEDAEVLGWEGNEESIYQNAMSCLPRIGVYNIGNDGVLGYQPGEDAILVIESEYGGMASAGDNFYIAYEDEIVSLLDLVALDPSNVRNVTISSDVEVADLIQILDINMDEGPRVRFKVDESASEWMRTGEHLYDFETGPMEL